LLSAKNLRDGGCDHQEKKGSGSWETSGENKKQSYRLLLFLASPLDILPVGSLVRLNVCEPPHFGPYGVEFLA
jgi:hypothetical protein